MDSDIENEEPSRALTSIPSAGEIREALQSLRSETAGDGITRIIDVILKRPHDVVGMTLGKLAKEADVSDSLIIKTLKRVGLSGLQKLKLALIQDLGSPTLAIHEDLQKDDDYATVIRRIFGANVQALRDTEVVFEPDLLKQAVEILDAAEMIEIYGIGSAAPIAEDAYYRLLRIGLKARVSVDSHIQVTTATIATPQTAVLTISHSGSTVETLDATRIAKEAGAKVVVITGYEASRIHEYADVALQTVAAETRFRTEAMTSRIAQLSIVDALIAGLALKRFDPAIATMNKTFNALSIKRV